MIKKISSIFKATNRNSVKKSKEPLFKHICIDDSIIDLRDPQRVIEPLWESVEITKGKVIYENNLKQFNNKQRAVFAILWYLAEVYNGGHLQFFTNATGIVWKDVLQGFKIIKIKEAEDVFHNMLKAYGKAPSFLRSEREEYLDKKEITFESQDKELYTLDEKIDINEIISDYIINNREDFYFDGKININ